MGSPDRLASPLRDFRQFNDFPERCARVVCHQAFVREPQSQGRKLEFLTQEMVRETNTIGSKANNVEVAHAVVEIKSAIERIREVVQNLE